MNQINSPHNNSQLEVIDLLNSMPDAVAILNAEFIITGINSLALKTYGWEKDNVVGENIFELIKYEFIDKNITLDIALSLLLKNDYWKGDVIFYKDNGDKIYFNTQATLIKNIEGKIINIVLVNTNITDKVLKENILKQAEIKYQTLIDALADGVILINNKGIITASNNRALEILETSEKNIIGINLANTQWETIKEDGTIFTPNEFPALKTLQTGKEIKNVLMGLKLQGNVIKWITINSKAILNESDDKPYAVVITFEDITKFKESNEKLRYSEILFSSFIENSKTANWIYDENGNILLANEKYTKIINSSTPILGKNINDLFDKDFAKTLITRNKKIIETGNAVITESQLKQADGSIGHFISNVFLITINGNNLIGGQAIEITDQIIATEKLKESELLFKSFMTNSQNIGWLYDETGHLIYGNSLFMQTVGFTEDAIGKHISTLSSKEISNSILEKNNEVLTSGKVLITEDKFVDTNGKTMYFIAHYFLVQYLNDKKFIGGHAINITERKKIEATLLNEKIQKQKQINKATIDAQEKIQNKLSQELHDNVNQLLMSSKLHIGVAKRSDINRPELLEKASNYLMMAIEEIRHLSKSLNSNIISIIGLKNGIIDIAKNLESLLNINVITFIDEEIIIKLSKEQQKMIFRITQELSNNIVKYSKASNVNISLSKINNNCQFFISDDGIGFDKNKTKYEGIGFLNIFNRVDTYNGKTEIITSPNNGCKIIITFPFFS